MHANLFQVMIIRNSAPNEISNCILKLTLYYNSQFLVFKEDLNDDNVII